MVEWDDFMSAIDRIVGGLEKKSRIITDEEKKSIATHEAGHATIGWLTRYGNPLLKVTIVPRGQALGAAWYAPEGRQIVPTQALLDEMCGLLGGRAAEEVFLGEVGTGASNDLERCTKIARALVLVYGMSDKLPNLNYSDSTGQDMGFTKPYSEDTGKIIDAEVSRIINEQYERAKQILRDHAAQHNQIRDMLLENEVIYHDDVEKILGKRPLKSRTDEIIEINRKEEEEAQKALPLPLLIRRINLRIRRRIPIMLRQLKMETLSLQDMMIRPIMVNHSIPQTMMIPGFLLHSINNAPAIPE